MLTHLQYSYRYPGIFLSRSCENWKKNFSNLTFQKSGKSILQQTLRPTQIGIQNSFRIESIGTLDIKKRLNSYGSHVMDGEIKSSFPIPFETSAVRQRRYLITYYLYYYSLRVGTLTFSTEIWPLILDFSEFVVNQASVRTSHVDCVTKNINLLLINISCYTIRTGRWGIFAVRAEVSFWVLIVYYYVHAFDYPFGFDNVKTILWRTYRHNNFSRGRWHC